MRSRRRAPVIPARRWASRARPSSSGIGTCASTPPIRSGRCATASCSRTGTPRCCSTRCCTCSAIDAPARRDRALPPARLEDAGPSGVRRDARRRGHDRARSDRASPTASAWRSPAGWRAPASASAGEGPGHHFVYGIVSDGDLMEGISSEAGSLAGHLGLGNLIYLYDDNRITHRRPDLALLQRGRGAAASRRSAGTCSRSTARTTWACAARWRRRARRRERPSLVIVRTVIGRGSPNRAGKSKAHGEPLGAEEVRLTKQAAGWPLAPEFLIPDDVRAYFAERIRGEARGAQRGRRASSRAGARRTPAQAAAWDAARARSLPRRSRRRRSAPGSRARTTPRASTARWCSSGSRRRRRTTSAARRISPARRRRRS